MPGPVAHENEKINGLISVSFFVRTFFLHSSSGAPRCLGLVSVEPGSMTANGSKERDGVKRRKQNRSKRRGVRIILYLEVSYLVSLPREALPLILTG